MSDAPAAPRLRIDRVLLGGACPAAFVGLLEAVALLAGAPRPELDLETVPTAVMGYAVAGALLAGLLWPLQRMCGRAVKTALFPWRVRPASARGLDRAWSLANLLLWSALVVGTDVVHLLLEQRLATPPGLAVLGGAFLATWVLGWFALPRVAAAADEPRSRFGAGSWLLALVFLSIVAPYALENWIWNVDQIPRRTALGASALGPDPLLVAEAPGPPTPGRPDVILITLDTTRADHLSAYGYERDTTPRLEEFAREAVRFDSAWSTTSWTLPSHATIFTGMSAASHGAHYKTAEEQAREHDPTRADQPTWVRPLDPKWLTLAELLQSLGYRTGGFIAGPYLLARFGTAQGFDWYDDRLHSSVGPDLALYHWADQYVTELEPDLLRFGHGYRRADEMNHEIFPWLRAQGDDRLFLFVNYFDAHEPYWPVASVRERYPGWDLPLNRHALDSLFREVIRGERTLSEDERRWIVSQYDAEIRFQDQHLGALFDELKALGRWDEALVIVTADHGEHLGEESRLNHGFTLYEPVIHIPMLVKFPASMQLGPGVRQDPVHLMDLLPTVLAALDLSAEERLAGQPLEGRTLLDDSQPRVVLSELYRDETRVARFGEQFSRNVRAWTTPEYRAIENEWLADGSESDRTTVEFFETAVGLQEERPVDDESQAQGLIEAMWAWIHGRPRYEPSQWVSELEQDTSGADALDEVGYTGEDDLQDAQPDPQGR